MTGVREEEIGVTLLIKEKLILVILIKRGILPQRKIIGRHPDPHLIENPFKMILTEAEKLLNSNIANTNDLAVQRIDAKL